MTGPTRLINLIRGREETIFVTHYCVRQIKQVIVLVYIQADDPSQSEGNDESEHCNDHKDDGQHCDDLLHLCTWTEDHASPTWLL